MGRRRKGFHEEFGKSYRKSREENMDTREAGENAGKDWAVRKKSERR